MHDRLHKTTLPNRLIALKEILFRLEMKANTSKQNNSYLNNEIMFLEWAINELANKYNFIYDKLKVKGFVMKTDNPEEYLVALESVPRRHLEIQKCSIHGDTEYIQADKSGKKCLNCLIDSVTDRIHRRKHD
jgi:hypothetical protein